MIHDISITLSSPMVTYPGDVPYQRKLQRNMDNNDNANVSQIEMSAHSGTHVDAPRHYYPNGHGAEDIPLEHLYGPAVVIDCRQAKAVTAELLKNKVPAGTKRLLLKTDNSALLQQDPTGPFTADFIYLAGDGAQFLAERGILLVAIDYLSIDKSGLREKPSHHILLENNITIVEGINLASVSPGEYYLACGPLKMAGSDGAPCRAVLIDALGNGPCSP